MLIFITILHSIVSVALIILILAHAGRGGMSDMFGGGVGAQAASGTTVQERNLDRLTVGTALIFGVTTLSLTWMLG